VLGPAGGRARRSGTTPARSARPALGSSSNGAFTTRLSSGWSPASQGLKIGPGFDSDSQLGPLISQEQLDRVAGYVAVGRAEGAELVCGGKPARRSRLLSTSPRSSQA
jgi:hypothetical protein